MNKITAKEGYLLATKDHKSFFKTNIKRYNKEYEI